MALASPHAAAQLTANLLLNGDFEQGGVAWVQDSYGGYAIVNYEPASAHGGSHDAWFGGYHSGTDRLYQDVAIPANATTASFSFWYQVSSEETQQSIAHDALTVRLHIPGVGLLAHITTVSSLPAGGWTQSATFDLSAYRGQTVRVYFEGSMDSLYLTSFRLDDVRLEVTVPASDARLSNISTRMQVLTGNDVMIGGFAIAGTANKTVAIVVTGLSLTRYGISNPLGDPMLTLVRSSDQAVLATNNDWQAAANAAQLQASGFAPPHPTESAILISLAPGLYTAIVQGVGATTGVAIVAVYEVDGPASPLTNISTRGRVLTGDDVMIGGFVIQGTGPQTVAIVATGPSLNAYGISTPLANPTLTLVRASDQMTIAINDNWQTDSNASLLQAAGFAPTNALESGIHITLQPGAYTAILSGAGGGTGVGVIGVYKVN